MKKRIIMLKKNILIVIFVVILSSLGFTQDFRSWGDKNLIGNRESLTTALYTPARYAFDGNKNTYWSLEEDKHIGWAEHYWEYLEDIKGIKVNLQISEGSELIFKYEKDGNWISYANGKIEGPISGEKVLLFPEEQRKTKKLLVILNSKNSKNDKIYEIELLNKENSASWGLIKPKEYKFNQKEYINLSPSRLWNGYVNETWFEPLWYIQWEIQNSKDMKDGIFSETLGNPIKPGEIIWELDSNYRIDLIKAYFSVGWRNIAFDFWDGQNWINRKELKDNNKTGWNRIDITNGIVTNRIKITFPYGWENARFINQLEIWGEAERENCTRSILYNKINGSNKYETTISNIEDAFIMDVITDKKNGKILSVNINDVHYNGEVYFESENEKDYKLKVKKEDIRNGIQYIEIETDNEEIREILISDDKNRGNVQLHNYYSDGYQGIPFENRNENDFEKKIKLDRKYEIEKIRIYTEEGSNLKLCTDSYRKNYSNFSYNYNGYWEILTKGLLTDNVIIKSERVFDPEEIEIYGSPIEDKDTSVEIWSSCDNVEKKSCIIGWMGCKESHVYIDDTINPRQEGNLFWMPVSEIRGDYLTKTEHFLKCVNGNISTQKIYKINKKDDTKDVRNKLKNYPLLLTIDIPNGDIITQSSNLTISGRCGNGDEIRVWINENEVDVHNCIYESLISLEEGNQVVKVKAEDITGRCTEKRINVIRDSIIPEITICSPLEGEYINTGKVEFSIDGNNDAELWWQFNDEEWERGYGKIKYKTYYLDDDFYSYSVTVQDRAGNIGETKYVNFCIDVTEPNPFDIFMNIDDWSNNNQPIAMFNTYDDTSGINHYEYKIDDNGWTVCESPLQIETLRDGIRVLKIRAIDNAKNIHEEESKLYIDTSIPPTPKHARPVSSEKSIVVKWEGLNDNSIVNEVMVEREGRRSYKIERSPEWDEGVKYLKNYGYGELQYEDTEVEVGASYSYRVWAVDRAGNESEKTEWKSAITGLAVAPVMEEGSTIVEYDGMIITLEEGSVPKDIIEVQISKVPEEEIEDKPVNPIVGNTYMVTAVRTDGVKKYVTNHADLYKPAVIEITYKPELIPAEYSKSEIAAFYYDDIWGCWMRMPDSYIETTHNNMIFKTNHFTDFSVQATKKAVLTEAELRESAYKLKSEKIGPSDVIISAENGGVSLEFTEYISPGIDDMQLPIQRVYSSASAYSSACGEDEDTIDGERIWKIADGWKINMPYMNVNGDSVILYGLDGQVFNIGQMVFIKDGNVIDNSDYNYHIVMENHEYNDIRVELFFEQKEKIRSFLSKSTEPYYSYKFRKGILYQNDGKILTFSSNGNIESITDCTQQKKICFNYYSNNIEIIDTLGNKITFDKKKGYISKISIDNKDVVYQVKDKTLEKATDVGKREWNYSYETVEIIHSCYLIEPPENYKQAAPNIYNVNILSTIEGQGIGYIKIYTDIKSDCSYEDSNESNGKTYSYNVTRGQLYAVRKDIGLNSDNILRTTTYELSFDGPVEKQFYVAKSVVHNELLETTTIYGTSLKSRVRISNAPEAINYTWNNKSVGEKEKNNKQVVTFIEKTETRRVDDTDTGVSIVADETVEYKMNTNIMRPEKVITKKGNNETEVTYIYDENKGSLLEEKHIFTSGDRKTSTTITREYADSINNRLNVIIKEITISSSGIEEYNSEAITESFEYNDKGQLIQKTDVFGTWNYNYSDGYISKIISPENKITTFTYETTNPTDYSVKTVKNNTESTITYNKYLGTIKNTIDADGYFTSFVYDALGRVTSQYKYTKSMKDETPTVGRINTIIIKYDDSVMTTTITDELGCVTTNYFDNLGRLYKVEKNGRTLTGADFVEENKTITILLVYDRFDRILKYSEPSYNKITNLTADFTLYSYDNYGNIVSLEDSDNRKITVINDYKKNTTTRIIGNNLQKSIIYKDSNLNIIKTENFIDDFNSVISNIYYDGLGRKVCTIDENGNKTIIKYKTKEIIDKIIFPNELEEEYLYNKDGKQYGLRRIGKDSLVYEETYTLNEFDFIEKKEIPVKNIDEEEKILTNYYTYDNRGNCLSYSSYYSGEHADTWKTVYSKYDYAGNKISETDNYKNTTTYTYDVKGNLIEITDPRESNLEYKGEFFIKFEYDSFGRMIKSWTPHSDIKRDRNDLGVADVLIVYDAKGNVINRKERENLFTENTYSKTGELLESKLGTLSTKYEYDDAKRIIKEIKPNGISIIKSYDKAGRIKEEITGNVQKGISYTYDKVGNIKAIKDRNGNVTTYSYDCMNNRILENIAGLTEKKYKFDSFGRKIEENDKEKNKYVYEYDELNRLIKEISPTGSVSTYSYDARGNILNYIDANNTRFSRIYNKNNKLLKEEVYKDNTYLEAAQTKTFSYDEGGMLKSVTEGNTSILYNFENGKYQGNAYGNITEMKWKIDNTDYEMKYSYDGLNRLTKVTNPDGESNTYTYNINNQITSMSNYIEGIINYNNKNQLISYTTLSGITKIFEYNQTQELLNIIKYEKFDDIKAINTGFIYSYDNNFNIVQREKIENSNFIDIFDYDEANRLKQSYVYGNFKAKNWTNSTKSNYFEINRDLTKQLNTPNQSTQYEIISKDEAPDYTYFDAKGKSFVYDFTSSKTVCKIEIYPDSKTHRVQKRHFSIYKYEEDIWKEIDKSEWKFKQDYNNKSFHILFKSSIKTTKLKIHNNFDDRNEENISVNEATFKNKKDNMIRIWLLDNNKNENYSYDENGNRIRLIQNNESNTLLYYKNNEGGNTAMVKYDGQWWYTYDNNGNRTSKGKVKLSDGNSYIAYCDNNNPGSREENVEIDKSYEYWEYFWDLNNRLIQVEQKKDEYDDELVYVEYTYDALNFRISRKSTLEGTVTRYAYGRNGALTYEEFSKDNVVVGSRSYAYFNDQVIGFTDTQRATEQKRYAVTDILGTVTQIYSEDNELLWDNSYTAFGIPGVATTDKFEGVFEFCGMFTGCQYDNETGLTYHWNRWRSEEGNNFITQDPARDGGNWYAYCNNSPLSNVDPSGLVPVKSGPVRGTLTHIEIQKYLTSTYGGSPQLYLKSPNPGAKGGFFVDYERESDISSITTEFYEIKPDTYMKSKRGDKQLEKYLDRAGDGFVKGTEILSDIDGTVINTNILSDNPNDFSGTITLHTDIENHPGMIFYSLDDGKTMKEKVMETVSKVATTVAGAIMAIMGAPSGVPEPIPAPALP